MKPIYLTILTFILVAKCFGQDKNSSKKFEDIALLNRISFIDSKFDQSKFSCAFLLKFKNDTFGVTAKHLLKHIKSDQMKGVSFENGIKSWSLFSLNKPSENIIVDELLNENKGESISEKAKYYDDWLVFSIKENNSKVKALDIRETPLIAGEKVYVVGWTREMENGEQRVYEFEYYKTIGKRILLKDILVPEKLGGLSGGPVVDSNGKIVGIVSNKTTDPSSGKSYFSPCSIIGLQEFLEKLLTEK